MFTSPSSSSLIEIQGCLYNFETPNSNIKIKFFQSGVGKDVPNGLEFLKYLKPVRELLATDQIQDIRQLVQRELDDVRIINSLVPYILNENNILGESGIAFFPSVLGVLMPKNYLNQLNKVYPSINAEKQEIKPSFKVDYYESDGFNWSVKNYKDESGNPLAFSSLTIDRNNCDVVIIDGQHRINAFRAACDALTTDNDVVKQIYNSCIHYPDNTKVNLPVTLLWFEIQDNVTNVSISPEIISRKLFIDVNNSAKGIATSRKILLDDRNPVNLITNHFYSLVAENFGYGINCLSLAHLGFDVPSEVSQQQSFNSIPFTYITTPERLKYVFDAFFVRSKSYSIGNGIKTLEARKKNFSASITTESTSKTQLNIMLPTSSELSIVQYDDVYLETKVLYVSDDLLPNGKTKQDIIRNEFHEQFFSCFYKLFSEFDFFRAYISRINEFHDEIINTGDVYEEATWKSVFLDGKSLFFTLRNKSQESNVFSKTLNTIEKKFCNTHLKGSFQVYGTSGTTSETELFASFRTLAFQIGYAQAFYEYCKLIHDCNFSIIDEQTLNEYCDEFIQKVNRISYSEWANYFIFLRDLQGETHPKFFPVITHLILRKIQEPNTIFDSSIEDKYMSPECFYFHQKTIDTIKRIIADNFSPLEIKSLTLNDILSLNLGGRSYREIFEEQIESKKMETEDLFNNFLNIPTTYLDECFNSLSNDIYRNLQVK
jgi:hypothetical protein